MSCWYSGGQGGTIRCILQADRLQVTGQIVAAVLTPSPSLLRLSDKQVVLLVVCMQADSLLLLYSCCSAWPGLLTAHLCMPQIRSYVFDVVRGTVPKINLDDVFTVRSSCSHAACACIASCVTLQQTWAVAMMSLSDCKCRCSLWVVIRIVHSNTALHTTHKLLQIR